MIPLIDWAQRPHCAVQPRWRKSPAIVRGGVLGHCNSYLVVAQDIAGADDHRNGSNVRTWRRGGEFCPLCGLSTVRRIHRKHSTLSVSSPSSTNFSVAAGVRRQRTLDTSQMGEPAMTKPEARGCQRCLGNPCRIAGRGTHRHCRAFGRSPHPGWPKGRRR
jgi:hypothetical protein